MMTNRRVIRFGWVSTFGIAVTVAGVLAQAPAQELRRDVDALRPPHVSERERAMLDNLEQRAASALAAIPRAHSAREADAARPELRRKLERSLGAVRLPWPPTLHPRLVGTLERPGYRIEKLVYETLPGAPVPAHLYLPETLKGRVAAVLFYPGHWWPDSKARPDFQAFCINMARLGFVVLSFDPFGQGERGISSRDHRRTEALLVGVAQQGFAEYETRCALEYLLSRPEVDPDRLGITGASGGGYNTWMTAALDDRIRAAVPVVGTSEFGEQIHVCRPLDWYHAAEHCHFVPGLIRYANNHELLAMAAPKPVLIIAAVGDQSFPLPGIRNVAEYGRRLFESYGAGGKIGLVVDEAEGHGYQRAKREAAYGWFLRWLMNRGDGSPHREPPTEVIPAGSEGLRCFAPGANKAAGPAMIAAVERLARDLPPSSPRLDLDAVLGPRPAAAPNRVRPGPGRVQRLNIATEPGIDVPAFLVRPGGEPRGVVVAADDRGKEAVASDPLVLDLLARGWAICGVDPRGIGESATDKMGWVFAVSVLLGENFTGRQAWDLGRVATVIRADPAFAGKPVALYARGPGMALAGVYAVARPDHAFRGYVLRDGFLTYRAFFERPKSLPASFRLQAADRDRTTAFDREIPAHFFAFDALRHFDLPQLLASSPAAGMIVDPIDGDREPLADAAARALLPPRVVVGSERAVPEFLRGLE